MMDAAVGKDKRVEIAIGLLVGVLLAAPVLHAAEADRYPVRPVRIITGSVGSTSDQVARFTAQKLFERWGQQFVVDNRAGAGGTIGTDIAAKAVPDGYTLTIGHAGTHVSAVSLFKNLPYDPLKKWTPIIKNSGIKAD